MAGGCAFGRGETARRAARWTVGVLCASLAGVVTCGGFAASVGAGQPAVDGGSRLNEASSFGQSCSVDSDCLVDARNGPEGHEGGGAANNLEMEQDAGANAEAGRDAMVPTDGSVLCGYYTGPLARGSDAGGPAIQCDPGWVCVTLNGAWACCTVEGSGGVSTCQQPFLIDGG
jgi:hypothetical protein